MIVRVKGGCIRPPPTVHSSSKHVIQESREPGLRRSERRTGRSSHDPAPIGPPAVVGGASAPPVDGPPDVPPRELAPPAPGTPSGALLTDVSGGVGGGGRRVCRMRWS